MKGFKLFRINNKREIMSCVVKGLSKVKYKVGRKNCAPKWLAEKGKHLTFFSKLIDAINFKSSLAKTQVWEVRAQKVVVRLSPKADIDKLSKGIIASTLSEWSTGTKMAKTIIPVKKIDRSVIRKVQRKRKY